VGKGFERNGYPQFSETDFDGWFLFLKTHLGRIVGVDDATTLVNDVHGIMQIKRNIEDLDFVQIQRSFKQKRCKALIVCQLSRGNRYPRLRRG
jgi:hypothetical protein